MAKSKKRIDQVKAIVAELHTIANRVDKLADLSFPDVSSPLWNSLTAVKWSADAAEAVAQQRLNELREAEAKQDGN